MSPSKYWLKTEGIVIAGNNDKTFTVECLPGAGSGGGSFILIISGPHDKPARKELEPILQMVRLRLKQMKSAQLLSGRNGT